MNGNPSTPPGGRPTRRTVVITMLLTVLIAGSAGLVAGLVRSPRSTPAAVQGTEVSEVPGTTTTGPTTSQSKSSSTTTTSSTSATASTSTSLSGIPTFQGPAGYISAPWNDSSTDFGALTAVVRTGSTVSVSFDRAQFLTGTTAQSYYASHTDEYEQEYAILNSDKRIRTFTVDPSALLFSQTLMKGRSSVTVRSIDLQELLANASTVATRRPWVWLRHSAGLNSSVTYLAEFYVP
jgi:hypothetical protein